MPANIKVVRTLIEIKQYFVAISFLGTPLWQPECEALLRFCRAFHGEIEALHFALLLSTLQNGCLWPMVRWAAHATAAVRSPL